MCDCTIAPIQNKFDALLAAVTYYHFNRTPDALASITIVAAESASVGIVVPVIEKFFQPYWYHLLSVENLPTPIDLKYMLFIISSWWSCREWRRMVSDT